MKPNFPHFILIPLLAVLLSACGSSSSTESDTDTDGDGFVDSQDAFPQDAKESKDTDGDGVGDNADVFPEDASETLDADSDKVGDNSDNCPQTANTDQTNTDANFENGDALGDACDADDDADDTLDAIDAFPQDPTETIDEDGDKIGDNKDLDITSSNKQEKNSISLTRLIETGRATRFIGPQANANSTDINNQVVNAGDINKDGFEDMLISIPGYKQSPDADTPYNTGIVYLFFGGAQTWPQSIDLNNIPADVTHVKFEKQAADDSDTLLGFRLAALGDMNGDAIDDFAISATKANSSSSDNVGAVHIVYGRTTWLTDAGDDQTISYAELKANYALSFYGDISNAGFGGAIASVGDFNGDGQKDIAIGQPFFDSRSTHNVGRLYVLFGGSLLNQETGNSVSLPLSTTQSFRFTGSIADSFLGESIIALDNFDDDADNTHDLLAGINSAKQYGVFFGGKGIQGTTTLEYYMADDGLIIDGNGTAFDAVAAGSLLANDSNAQDILLMQASNTYVIKGGVGNWPSSIDIANIPLEYGVNVPFTAANPTSLAMLPDSNQDGLDEPQISSSNTNDGIDRVQKIENTENWLSESSTPVTVNSSIQNIMNDVVASEFQSLQVLGDMDSDGQLEFVLNAPQTNTDNGDDSGDFFVVKGFAQVYSE